MPNRTSAPPRPTSTLADCSDPFVSLTSDEYLALDFATATLRTRADSLGGQYPAIAASITRQADVLQGLHDRWHRASVLATEGRLHDPQRCGYCAGGEL